MKTNKILLATILAMFVLAVLPVISAALMDPVMNTPLNSSNHTGNVFVNCSTTHTNVTNVTAYATGDFGVTNVSLGALTNVTHDEWTGNLTLTSANDGANWNVTCYADNGTDQAYSTTTQGYYVMFDTTNPVCNITGDHNKIPWKGTILLTWDSSDAIELVSTAVYVDGPQDQTTSSYTDTQRFLTLLSQDTQYIGDWTTNITGTDRAGNTCTDTFSFSSYLPDGEIWEPSKPPVDTGKNLLLLIILGIVLWVIFGKKK